MSDAKSVKRRPLLHREKCNVGWTLQARLLTVVEGKKGRSCLYRGILSVRYFIYLINDLPVLGDVSNQLT